MGEEKAFWRRLLTNSKGGWHANHKRISAAYENTYHVAPGIAIGGQGHLQDLGSGVVNMILIDSVDGRGAQATIGRHESRVLLDKAITQFATTEYPCVALKSGWTADPRRKAHLTQPLHFCQNDIPTFLVDLIDRAMHQPVSFILNVVDSNSQGRALEPETQQAHELSRQDDSHQGIAPPTLNGKFPATRAAIQT